MRFVLFAHSLLSDWNHGNAHFLRGMMRAMIDQGHEVRVFEPEDGWSRRNLIAEHGDAALGRVAAALPGLTSTLYRAPSLDLDEALQGADLVIAHEWSDPTILRRLARHRVRVGGYRLLYHDTHHRAVSAPETLPSLDGFDGVLAYGDSLRAVWAARGWGRRAFTWHEAADHTLFRPLPGEPIEGDLVWIGNWGDGERTTELVEYLLLPIRQLGLKALIHGVRYPENAVRAVAEAGARWGGWSPNHEVPRLFARHRVTVHVPRRFYVEALPGIPTIRVFEALACGIPLVSAPWRDVEGLFRPGRDFLMAIDGRAMTRHLRDLLADPAMAAEMAASGLETIRARHTCAHRLDELIAIRREVA
ncbi:MAG: glycosyltransferase [Alphaproteobacteria bacterium]|nr:glycosyltransferase [Alphaproteobacteria bacterium]